MTNLTQQFKEITLEELIDQTPDIERLRVNTAKGRSAEFEIQSWSGTQLADGTLIAKFNVTKSTYFTLHSPMPGFVIYTYITSDWRVLQLGTHTECLMYIEYIPRS